LSSKNHKKAFHFVLDYESGRWKVDNGRLRAEGESLRDLDEKLKLLLGREKTGEDEKIRVTMEFNYERIPSWIVQYHPYYMFRMIDI